MKGAVRLTRLKVQNAGVLGERAVDLDGFGPGINVISGPNESGKSTLVQALRLALFERHSFTGKNVKQLRPHGTKLSPRVDVELDVAGTRYLLQKQFLEKAYARLHVGDDPKILEGIAADERVWDLVGAREGGKKGSTDDDQGVWGLLWVRQDDLAVKDPGESVGENTRGRLSTAIEQQVGAVMGGAEGVRLRERIEQEFARFWTPSQGRSTGPLAEHEKRVEALRLDVEGLVRREKDLETLASDVTRMEQRLQEADDEVATRRRDLEQAERDAREAEARERSFQEADAAHRDAQAAAAALRVLSDERASLRDEVTRIEESVRLGARALQQLRQDAAARRQDAAVAAQRLDEARNAVDAARRRADGAQQRIARLRARDDLARRDRELAEARRLDEQLRALQEEVRRLPDDEALKAAESIESRRTLAEQRVLRSATRVTVIRPGSDVEEHALLQRRELDLGVVGKVELQPPLPGFDRARRELREAAERLRVALAEARIASLAEAHAQADERRRVVTEHAVAASRLEAVAPKGLDALESERLRAEREVQELEPKHRDATALRESIERDESDLAALRVDAAAARELTALEARLQARRAAEAREGARVTIRPLAAVRVQIGARETPRLLTRGNEVRRALSRTTTIVIDDRVELEIDLGALVPDDAGETAEALEHALSVRLAELGVESVSEAHTSAELRSRIEGRLHEARAQFAKLAPDGVDASQQRLARAQRRLREIDELLRDARRLSSEHESLARRLSALPVSDETLAKLDTLDRAFFAREEEARRCAARVLSVGGAIEPRLANVAEILDPLRIDVNESRVEILPSEAESELEVHMLARDLRERLAGFDAEHLDGLRAKHRLRVAARATADESLRALARLAPGGLGALESQVVALRADLAGAEAEDGSIPALELEVAAARQLLEGADRGVAEGQVTERLQRDRSQEVERRLADQERVHADHEGVARAKSEQLAALRAARPDAALDGELTAQRALAARAEAARDEAIRAAEQATPDRRRADLARAQASLEEQRSHAATLVVDHARKRGELVARVEDGGHETLEDKRAELGAAEAELARVRQEAEALKLLRAEAEAAYGAAQGVLMKPVEVEVLRMLHDVRPGTRIRMNHQSLRLDSVTREGFEEGFDALSGGAREQLAIVVRVALARVFARQQRSLPLILDDVLGWTDDGRFRRMIQVLELAAQDLQVIVLTCHPNRFGRIQGATRFDLEQILAPTPSA